jgi:hypothetical protein
MIGALSRKPEQAFPIKKVVALEHPIAGGRRQPQVVILRVVCRHDAGIVACGRAV